MATGTEALMFVVIHIVIFIIMMLVMFLFMALLGFAADSLN